MAQKLIAGGGWVQVKVMVDGVLKAIGLATGASYTEDFGIQPANVLNHLGAISWDSQNYTCSIDITTFYPEASLVLYADGGEITIKDLLPTRDEVQLDGRGRVYEGLVFANLATGEVIHAFSEVIVASDGQQINPNQYVTSNVRFQAVKRVQ